MTKANTPARSGLRPELLCNRAFADCQLEAQLHTGLWNDGSDILATEIPSWYCDGAAMALMPADAIHDSRRAALYVDFAPGGSIWNTGCVGVSTQAGKTCRLCLYAKADAPVPLAFTLEADNGAVLCREELVLRGRSYTRYDVMLTPDDTTDKACFVITAPEGGQMTLGLISLMAAEA